MTNEQAQFLEAQRRAFNGLLRDATQTYIADLDRRDAEHEARSAARHREDRRASEQRRLEDRRAILAGYALQGILAGRPSSGLPDAAILALAALNYADALLARLDHTSTPAIPGTSPIPSGGVG